MQITIFQNFDLNPRILEAGFFSTFSCFLERMNFQLKKSWDFIDQNLQISEQEFFWPFFRILPLILKSRIFSVEFWTIFRISTLCQFFTLKTFNFPDFRPFSEFRSKSSDKGKIDLFYTFSWKARVFDLNLRFFLVFDLNHAVFSKAYFFDLNLQFSGLSIFF